MIPTFSHGQAYKQAFYAIARHRLNYNICYHWLPASLTTSGVWVSTRIFPSSWLMRNLPLVYCWILFFLSRDYDSLRMRSVLWLATDHFDREHLLIGSPSTSQRPTNCRSTITFFTRNRSLAGNLLILLALIVTSARSCLFIPLKCLQMPILLLFPQRWCIHSFHLRDTITMSHSSASAILQYSSIVPWLHSLFI